MLYAIESTLSTLRKEKPLVLCLSNYVTLDFMANALLALGAAPIMTESSEELEALIAVSKAININIGTLNNSFMERAHLAVQYAKKYKIPIVLDPVGAGASTLRTHAALSLVPHASIVRGNASEILALTEDTYTSLGVEAKHVVSDAKNAAIQLAKNHHCIVAVSGAEDFITDGQKECFLPYGSPLMSKVTGMGCTLTAVIAAFHGVMTDAYEAARLATAYFGLCGTLTARQSHFPGSFRSLFIDALYATDINGMEKYCHGT